MEQVLEIMVEDPKDLDEEDPTRTSDGCTAATVSPVSHYHRGAEIGCFDKRHWRTAIG